MHPSQSSNHQQILALGVHDINKAVLQIAPHNPPLSGGFLIVFGTSWNVDSLPQFLASLFYNILSMYVCVLSPFMQTPAILNSNAALP